MPGTATTGSGNISLLDSKIIADLCAGKFYVDVSPSIYIGSGANNVFGANVQITSPSGIVVKPYGTNYEISPASSGGMNAVIEFAIPTLGGNYQYGNYKIDVQLFDGVNSWVVTKYVSICEPDQKKKNLKYGSLSARLDGSCKDGKVYVIVDTVPNYKGNVVESQVNDFDLEYPTSSGLPVLSTTLGSFSVQLFEGEYKITGTICATYNYGDNVYAKVNYKVKREKDIKCIIDECCIQAELVALHKKLESDCTEEEKSFTKDVINQTIALYKTAELSAACGEDPSEYITALETLLGCRCTCNCNEGTPIINTSPAKDFLIEGCGFTKTVVGLTDHYEINNYHYVVGVNTNGILTIGAGTLANCIYTQQLNFDVAAMYASVKAQANVDTTEANFWSSIINKSLAGIDPVCLGISQLTWQGYTFSQKMAALVVAICNCCGCTATVDSASTVKDGANVTITWTDTGEFSVDIYLDGVFMGNVLTDIDSFTFVGAADGLAHTWVLIPKCENGKNGVPRTGSFQLLGCPTLSPPVVSTNNANGVECPYDLTALVSTPPAGVTTEWHTANNTEAGTLVTNPAAVSSGVYYAFAKDADGCYSSATTVQVICEAATSCTAPQNLLVTAATGGFLVQFQSAAFPPPGNSYTVKRRLSSDPDVAGSYTTIGTPAWNATTSRWEILDATGANNTLYVYTAQSNCGDSPATTPKVYYSFANLTCPSLTLTPAETTIGYSFVGVGGSVDKYEVKLYNSTGVTLLENDTFTPAFSNPITGNFIGLTAGTSYKVRVRVYIGATYFDCPMIDVITTGGAVTYYWYTATEYNCSNCAVPIGSQVVASSNPALILNKWYKFISFGPGQERVFLVTATTTDPFASVPIVSPTSYNSCAAACMPVGDP